MKPENGRRGRYLMKLLFGIQELVWGPGLLFLFLGTGLASTLRLRGFQLLGFRRWWKATAGVFGSREKDAKSQTATACTALAATVGTGNIAGVATALAAGGPGAVFWMWVSAFLGMATAYAEVYLGIRYRRQSGVPGRSGESGGAGGMAGCGPFFYLEDGLGWGRVSVLYALFCLLASLGMGSMVQANAIGDSINYAFSIPVPMAAVITTALAAAVILGGAKRITAAAGILIPCSAGLYFFFGGIVVLSCFERIPAVLAEIFSQALNIKSAAGGAAGYTMAQAVRFGVARGVFSNEAGLGSLAVLHGTADADARPEEQGMWAMFEVFFDTIVSCTLTALILLCMGESGGGSAAVASAFAGRFGVFGGWFTAVSMALFAFSSIIAWFYLGKQAVEYVAVRLGGKGMEEKWPGRKMLGRRRAAETVYTACYVASVFLGCVGQLTIVWTISDIFNGLMAVPNLLGVLFLLKEVKLPEKK